jgi:hypothetical protein
MTASQFATELEVSGLRMVGNRIVSDDRPGITWKPVKTRVGKSTGPARCAESSENDAGSSPAGAYRYRVSGRSALLQTLGEAALPPDRPTVPRRQR